MARYNKALLKCFRPNVFALGRERGNDVCVTESPFSTRADTWMRGREWDGKEKGGMPDFTPQGQTPGGGGGEGSVPRRRLDQSSSLVFSLGTEIRGLQSAPLNAAPLNVRRTFTWPSLLVQKKLRTREERKGVFVKKRDLSGVSCTARRFTSTPKRMGDPKMLLSCPPHSGVVRGDKTKLNRKFPSSQEFRRGEDRKKVCHYLPLSTSSSSSVSSKLTDSGWGGETAPERN